MIDFLYNFFKWGYSGFSCSGYDIGVFNKLSSRYTWSIPKYGVDKKVKQYPYNDLHDWIYWVNLPFLLIGLHHIRLYDRVDYGN